MLLLDQRRSVLLYGDVSPNITDGSSIWLATMAEMLAGIFDEVHLLLKEVDSTRRVLKPVHDLTNVTFHPPFPRTDEPDEASASPRLTPRRAAQRIATLTRELRPNAIVTRGTDVAAFVSGNQELARIHWAYITDLPYPPDRISTNNLTKLQRITERAHRMFAQTEDARSYLESIAPAAAGKTVLLTPTVPDRYFAEAGTDDGRGGSPLRLVYSGKFARDWRTLEMIGLPRVLAELGVDAELVLIGDKVQEHPADPDWAPAMREALASVAAGEVPGVSWLGGMDRTSAVTEIRGADVGIGWRSHVLDASLELSTKALEYAAAGTPPLLNGSLSNRTVWGEDYPLYCTDDLHSAARTLRDGISVLDQARRIATAGAEPYSLSRAAARLHTAFRRGSALTSPAGVARPTKVLVASHDLKFFGEIVDWLEHSPDVEVRIDRWSKLAEHDVETSTQLLEWADVIFCEWAGPNLAWYSRRKRPAQRLVARLHRFEINGPWWPQVETGAIDEMVYVSDYFRRRADALLDLGGIPSRVIPNTLDTLDLARPKLPGAEFHLGLIGFVSFGKRPDRALDLLDSLLDVDDRYVLHLKGRMPWEYSYEWDKPAQRHLYLDLFDRLRQDARLREHVVFDEFSPDIASWLRGIGTVLSPSVDEFESFHLAPAEGMASGAAAVFWDREGVDELFGDDLIASTLAEARDRILELRSAETRERVSRSARARVARWDIDVLSAAWSDALTPVAAGAAPAHRASRVG